MAMNGHRLLLKLFRNSSFCLLLLLTFGLSAQQLFQSKDIIDIKLEGPVSELLKDRGDEPRYHNLSIAYTNDDSIIVTLPVRVRVRGNFRRLKSNCLYPPLLLNFSELNTGGTLFEGQDKIKLVMPCQGDRYVLHEYLVYQLYNLVTPRSFRARLVRVHFVDPSLKPKNTQPFYGILLEEEDQMAKRNDLVSVDRALVKPEQTQPLDFLKMAVFEYMIGNTDWSVQYRQNVKLIAIDTLAKPITVPYDFDHAGIVGAPYAKPAQELQLSSTRERRYRGYCISDMNHFTEVLEHYNALKDEVYRIYTDNPLLDEGYRKSTLKYLDEFYKTINDPKRVKEEFQYPCRKDGTGGVVIKGLKNN